ncbi:MAG: TIGR02646 family protein [Deltaproteobacteria bacterium]|nr:TIGR02646 family protein [Deltaproteobacteria bacterium]
MKRIVKRNDKIQQQIDSWVTQAKRKNEADWNHFSHDNVDGGIYPTTKTSLIDEQGSICCYCERQIGDSSCHIEHFHGKGRYPKQMFDYANLHASCDGFPDKANHCCGHRRAQQRNPDIPVSPLDEDCESRFRYTGRGAMKPADENDKEAETTVAALGLDSPKLRGMRRSLMIELENCLKCMSNRDFAAYVDQKLQPDANGRFPELFTTIRQYAGELQA